MKTLLFSILLTSSTLAASFTIAPDQKSFLHDNKPFTPRGFNYDRDHRLRLLEDYWQSEWPTVEQDFREMKDLGANVVRIHLQFAKFMDGPDKPNAENLAQLKRLVRLAQDTGLYLDVTGLGCYRKSDVPDWYNDLDENARWHAQANFWEAVAQTCSDSPAIFCYDLMNEPLVPAANTHGDWLHPFALGGFHYVQHITTDPRGRDREQIARDWTRQLVAAIRAHDKDHLITIGMLPFENTGFTAQTLRPELDFIAVHIYPESKKLNDATKTLERFSPFSPAARGGFSPKPLLIEETFPMKCSIDELEKFLTNSHLTAAGYLGFYWGQTPADLKSSNKIGDKVTLAWLELFQKMARP